MKKYLPIVLTAALTASAVVHAAGDPQAGQAKATPCAGCHGQGGNSANPEWPKLAGQHPKYLAKEIRDFREGKSRSNPMMAPMVSGLSDQDALDLAAYFSLQKPTGGYAREETVALGEKIYRGGKPVEGMAACMSCHGPSGSGNPSGAIPAVSGQHSVYTANQLKAFRSGSRSNDPYGIMRTVTKRMTDEEIKAVSEYIEGLH
jgi:cytochrome c553